MLPRQPRSLGWKAYFGNQGTIRFRGVEQPCLFIELANRRTYRRSKQDLDLAESASTVDALDGGVTICRLALCRLSPVGRCPRPGAISVRQVRAHTFDLS
jgi:hypothetical protein